MGKLGKNILIAWLALIVAIRISLLFPHRYLNEIRLINTWLQILLFIIFLVIAYKSNNGQRLVYVIFASVFGLVFFLFLGSFVGSALFQGNKYVSFYYHFYVNIISCGFTAIFPVTFLLIDYLFSAINLTKKIIFAFAIALCLLMLVFNPYWYSPDRLTLRSEYLAVKNLTQTFENLSDELNRRPTDKELLARANYLPLFLKNEEITLLNQINELRAHIDSRNVTPIFWKPVNLLLMYIYGLSVVLWLLLLWMVYKINHSYYPYLDKIIGVLILFYSAEIFHKYGAIVSVSMQNYRLLFDIGQYITVFILLLLIYVAYLNLRFVISPAGSYYSTVLVSSPYSVTRWRDEIDNMILKVFTRSSDHAERIADIKEKKGRS